MLPLLLLLFVAAAKKQATVTVRFHTETNARDGEQFASPATLMYPPRKVFLSRVPDISEVNIQAIYPFQAADGTFGCSFKLDENGRIALDTLSVDRRGTSLVAFVNGRQVIDMQIDKRVSDAIVTIPRGLAPQEVQGLSRKFKIIGQEKKRAKEKR
jgi:hypothetical protein